MYSYLSNFVERLYFTVKTNYAIMILLDLIQNKIRKDFFYTAKAPLSCGAFLFISIPLPFQQTQRP